MSELVRLEHDGAVTTITIDRPDKMNALDAEVLGALSAAFDGVRARPETRCAILTGAGKAFVAGADIASMVSMTPAQAKDFSALGQRVFASIEALACPVIGAVNGFALGGGCELALACDFIYVSEKAKLGQPEVKLGVIPGFGGTQRLARRVGLGVARELIYTGRLVDAAEAVRIGLANAAFASDALLEKARETAKVIAAQGPRAVALAKQVMLEGTDGALADGNALEVDAFAKCFETTDQTEGMNAFLERRDPSFTGS